uniref:Uncharacterized protein n=1 Tax=Manihot esculenta TaxID=3983 RepID=A0A2C9V241_MANES
MRSHGATIFHMQETQIEYKQQTCMRTSKFEINIRHLLKVICMHRVL